MFSHYMDSYLSIRRATQVNLGNVISIDQAISLHAGLVSHMDGRHTRSSTSKSCQEGADNRIIEDTRIFIDNLKEVGTSH